MSNILLDLSLSMVKKDEMENMNAFIQTAHRLLHESLGAGKEFTGWLDLPNSYDEAELNRIKYYAEKIKKESQAFVVIGIGGSYLGARALIEALNHNFYNELSEEKRKGPAIYYAGNNISSNYIWDLIDLLEDKDISINVISKSGTTTEPAIAFRVFKEYMEKKYGKAGAKERIYVTTDKTKGALRELAEVEGYTSFTIPEDIGGRYSVLTSVGLLPIAVAGIDIEELLKGAREGMKEYSDMDLNNNICYQYAAVRNILYNRGKDIELLVNYEPNLQYFAEWWKQLFGESEGKDKKGIFPASCSFTTDLHSLGQLIQDGRRNLFETVIHIENPRKDMTIKEDDRNLDNLNYLAKKSINFVNKKAFQATLTAHAEGGVPNIVIKLPELNERYMGKLIYLFQKACAISGYMLGVNPFDQPGVEEYKRNMFRLLGKPGY